MSKYVTIERMNNKNVFGVISDNIIFIYDGCNTGNYSTSGIKIVKEFENKEYFIEALQANINARMSSLMFENSHVGQLFK